jgi:NAD(P)-dependent dehydrogenase (short-subunit alcohol dehydrogenase family)
MPTKLWPLAAGVRADVTGDLAGSTLQSTDEVFTKATAAMPEIDVLVNNAGNYNDVPFLAMDYERFERTFRLNVFSVFFRTQKFPRPWVQQKTAGRVLMIGSINARLAEQTHSGYDTLTRGR